MKHMLAVVCCLVLCSAPGFAQNKSATKPMTDQQFVDFAAQTDMVEANLGQRAQNVASSEQVKDYGQMLVTDHTNNYHQLWEAAKEANLTVPDAIDAAHDKSMIDPLDKLKGTAFDHHYVKDMVAGHTKAIAVYRKEADNAQNEAIKNYAQDSIPMLEKHLDQAKDLEKKK